MEEKSTKIKFKRAKNKKTSRIEALTLAQKIAFAPFSFQVVAAMLDFGILTALSETPCTKSEIMKICNLNRYIVDTLFDASKCIGLIQNENGSEKFSVTPLAEAFLYDEMTRVNFNFTKDVCYLAANELTESFRQGRPVGLKKHYFPEAKTIYPMLTKLSDVMRKSWYEFDHHYSDDCFDEILPIMFNSSFASGKEKTVFDIGGNTGKFEKACLEYDRDCTVTMFDLEENIETARKNVNNARCNFVGIDILSDVPLPKISGFVLMSQFLDCFSREQILFILNKVALALEDDAKVFILEPFIDKQVFEGAAYALSHISLYFTCMANGNSKMYNEADMLEIIGQSDLKFKKAYQNIGKYDYTLLECMRR